MQKYKIQSKLLTQSTNNWNTYKSKQFILRFKNVGKSWLWNDQIFIFGWNCWFNLNEKDESTSLICPHVLHVRSYLYQCLFHNLTSSPSLRCLPPREKLPLCSWHKSETTISHHQRCVRHHTVFKLQQTLIYKPWESHWNGTLLICSLQSAIDMNNGLGSLHEVQWRWNSPDGLAENTSLWLFHALWCWHIGRVEIPYFIHFLFDVTWARMKLE